MGEMRPTVGEEVTEQRSDIQIDTLRGLPFNPSLHPHQRNAIEAAEQAISSGQMEMSIVMAVGSGKTMTMMTIIYRLMKSGIASRILYLTKSKLLAEQAYHALSVLEVESGVTLSSVIPTYSKLPKDQLTGDGKRAFVCVTTVHSLAALVRTQGDKSDTRRAIHPNTVDLIICDDFVISEAASWRRAIDYFNAIKIAVGSTVGQATSKPAIYNYDLKAAIRDNVLVAYNTTRIRPNIEALPSRSMLQKTLATRRVFVGCSSKDSTFAYLLTSMLREQGLSATLIQEGQPNNWKKTSAALDELAGGDFLVVLLSPNSMQSLWAQPETYTVLERRGVEIVPAVFMPCFIPKALTDRTVVDLVSTPDNLMRALYVAARIDLGALTPRKFEELVADLLHRLNFEMDKPVGDPGIDFRSTYNDPLGFGEPVQYLIQVKARGNRASVDSLNRLAGIIVSEPHHTCGLLVTSGQLTSVATDALSQLKQRGISIRVMDGLRLKNHLLAFPDLIGNYFLPFGDVV